MLVHQRVPLSHQTHVVVCSLLVMDANLLQLLG